MSMASVSFHSRAGSRNDAEKEPPATASANAAMPSVIVTGSVCAENFRHASIPVLRGIAQVSAEQIAQVADVLLPKRTVQFVLGQQLLLDGGRNFSLRVKRPAGRNADQKERDRDHAEQHGHQTSQTADEESDHPPSCRL